MTLRFGNFYVDGVYHVFNREVDRQTIFKNEDDYNHLILLLRLMNSTERIRSISQINRDGDLEEVIQHIEEQQPLVEIQGYSLLSNHFHLVIKQVQENGVSLFMQKVGSAYSQYFNRKYKRRGTLFEGMFKFVVIENDFHHQKMLSYVNRNHEIHKVIIKYSQTSGHYCITHNVNNIRHFTITNTIGTFGTIQDYQRISRSVVHDTISEREEKKRERGDLLE